MTTPRRWVADSTSSIRDLPVLTPTRPWTHRPSPPPPPRPCTTPGHPPPGPSLPLLAGKQTALMVPWPPGTNPRARPRPGRHDGASRAARGGRSWPAPVTLRHDAGPPSPTANPGGPPAGYGRHKGLVFACVSVGLFMVAVDQTIVATALPSIQSELHTRINWAGWTITIYSLAQVVAMPVAGKLSDQFGRKTIFICAAAVFTTASLCCGLSNSIYLLIALRGVQALGGGCIMPSASGIVADQFGPDRDRALAMFTSILPIGGIVGPVLGGLFVTYWTWRGIFFINVPIGLALIILSAVVIPRSTRRDRAPVDVLGVLLLGTMLLAVMFGFAFLGAGSSPASWSFLVPEVLGLTAGLLFVRHIQRHAGPVHPGPAAVRARVRGHEPDQFRVRRRGAGAVCGRAAVRRAPVPAAPARRRHAADQPCGGDDRRRRDRVHGVAAHRVPAADDPRIQPDRRGPDPAVAAAASRRALPGWPPRPG